MVSALTALLCCVGFAASAELRASFQGRHEDDREARPSQAHCYYIGWPVSLFFHSQTQRREREERREKRVGVGERGKERARERLVGSGVVLWSAAVTSVVACGTGIEFGDLGVRRRAFWGNCVVFWLLLCKTAMTETCGAQPSATGSVIFYSYPLAFNPAKAKLALEEKGIKYTEKKVDLFNGQSLEPWYLKLNPNASTPTLVAGDEKIIESADIIRWADRQGTSLGGDSVDRAFVNEWLEKVDAWDGNLFVSANSGAGAAVKFSTKYKIKVAEAHAKRNPELAELYKQKIVQMEKTVEEMSDPALIEKNVKQITGLLDEAEAVLSSRKFIAGDTYSAADTIFTPVIYRMYLAKKEKEYVDTRPNLKRYYEEMKKRPSYKKVFSVSDSGIGTASTVLPALGKILFSKATGRY